MLKLGPYLSRHRRLNYYDRRTRTIIYKPPNKEDGSIEIEPLATYTDAAGLDLATAERTQARFINAGYLEIVHRGKGVPAVRRPTKKYFAAIKQSTKEEEGHHKAVAKWDRELRENRRKANKNRIQVKHENRNATVSDEELRALLDKADKDREERQRTQKEEFKLISVPTKRVETLF